MTISDYKKILKGKLSDKRYKHSVNVSKTAVYLAKRHGADEKKAKLAGLLHDIMKEATSEEQLKLIEDFGIILSDIEISSKMLWHQIAGAVYVWDKLEIHDEDIFNAIRHHTSGRKYMSLLEKVIFIADYISEDRDYDGVDLMRKLADKDLNLAMVEGLSFSITELLVENKPIIIGSVDAYNEALKSIEN